MKIYIGADHRGFEHKEVIKKWLLGLDHEVIDCGNSVLDPDDDYVDFAITVAEKVAGDISDDVITTPTPKQSRGIVICGSSAGVNIAANKVKGVRASVGFSIEEVRYARKDDDLNVLALSARYSSIEDSKKMIEVFISQDFDPKERYIRRINKITNYENK